MAFISVRACAIVTPCFSFATALNSWSLRRGITSNVSGLNSAGA